MLKQLFLTIGVRTIRSRKFPDGSYHEYTLDERMSSDGKTDLCIVDKHFKGVRDTNPEEAVIEEGTEQSEGCRLAFMYNFPDAFNADGTVAIELVGLPQTEEPIETEE